MTGCCVGSFLCVVAERSLRGENYVTGRSHCDYCGHKLKWFDLIPLVSWMLLKGRCRYCNKKIGITSFLVELICGISYLLISMRYSGFIMIMYILLVSVMLLIALRDLKSMTVSGKSLNIIFIISIIIMSVSSTPVEDRWKGLSVFAILLIIKFLFNGFGDGDIYVFLLLGISLGFEKTILTFLLSLPVCCIYGTVMKKGGRICYLPSVYAGLIISLTWGEMITDWYLYTFF